MPTDAYWSQLNIPGLFWFVQKACSSAARNHHPVPQSHQSETEGKRRTSPVCTFHFSPTSPKADGYFHGTYTSFTVQLPRWPWKGLVGPHTHRRELLNRIIKLLQRRLISSPRFLRLKWGAGLRTGHCRCHHLVPAGQEPPRLGLLATGCPLLFLLALAHRPALQMGDVALALRPDCHGQEQTLTGCKGQVCCHDGWEQNSI